MEANSVSMLHQKEGSLTAEALYYMIVTPGL